MEDMVEEVLENARIWEDAPTPKDEVFFRINGDKFDALMETVDNDFKKANTAVLRRIDDVYGGGSKKVRDYPLLSTAMEEGFLH